MTAAIKLDFVDPTLVSDGAALTERPILNFDCTQLEETHVDLTSELPPTAVRWLRFTAVSEKAKIVELVAPVVGALVAKVSETKDSPE